MAKKPDAEAHRLVSLVLDQLSEKWTLRILAAMCDSGRPVRFNELKRLASGVSQKTLTQCLRRLERSGLVDRRVFPDGPLGVEYSISRLGKTLVAPLKTLIGWAVHNGPRVASAQIAYDAKRAQ
jgi:DNA-binding HxlR family transcriptional regulator